MCLFLAQWPVCCKHYSYPHIAPVKDCYFIQVKNKPHDDWKQLCIYSWTHVDANSTYFTITYNTANMFTHTIIVHCEVYTSGKYTYTVLYGTWVTIYRESCTLCRTLWLVNCPLQFVHKIWTENLSKNRITVTLIVIHQFSKIYFFPIVFGTINPEIVCIEKRGRKKVQILWWLNAHQWSEHKNLKIFRIYPLFSHI